MAHAFARCVHCGFCLPACPTYKVLGEEMDSPRGRIFLMKEVLEGHLSPESVLPYIDRCLGCQACVPACPSGVPFGELLIPFRAHTEERRSYSSLDRVSRLLVLQTLPFPWSFRWAVTLGKLAQPFRGLLPGKLRSMLDLLPSVYPQLTLPEFYPAKGQRWRGGAANGLC
jgi:glycolate oxidase iron-sulfur subunit